VHSGVRTENRGVAACVCRPELDDDCLDPALLPGTGSKACELKQALLTLIDAFLERAAGGV
jgi:hypothetical protein